MDGSELADEMLDSVNSGVDSREVRDGVASGHRYLQNEVFSDVLRPAIEGLAGCATDRRNASAVNRAREICDALGWDY